VSDASQGPGWWLASDGKWYPPKEADQPPAPGWWLASDGKWYPPKESDQPPGPGWWLASDGKWYAPEARHNGTTAAPATKPSVEPTPPEKAGRPGRGRAKGGRRGRGRRGRGQAESTPAVSEMQAEPQRSARPEPEPAGAPSAPLARPGPRSEAPAQDRIRPNLNEGLSPLEQIERRNQASRADATVLAAKRAEAASRALGRLQAQVDSERPTAPPEVVIEPAAVATRTPERPPAPPAREVPSAAPPAEPVEPTPPLLEVKTSPLGADLEHLGDRLAIFVDRVELRDRLDRVRKSIRADDIVEVTVQKRLTGAVLTVESARGSGITAKGLRPDQADEARRLIFEKTRSARRTAGGGDDETRRSSTPTAATPAPTRPPSAPKVDAVALRAKLADLHTAGVLTDDEYQQKLLVVRRLANGEILSSPRR
jgi:hypothetical protein